MLITITGQAMSNCRILTPLGRSLKNQLMNIRLDVRGKLIHHRSINTRTTTSTALEILSLTHKPNFSQLDLRDAYFRAAKKCHPDIQQETRKDHIHNLSSKFMQATDAYEFLQKNRIIWKSNTIYDQGQTIHKNSKDNYYWSVEENEDVDSKIPETEEEAFREACLEYLGLQAESVEESKRCPLFRDWLRGNTEGAQHWKIFFMFHGGLAPRLNRTSALINDGGKNGSVSNKRIRRRRPT